MINVAITGAAGRMGRTLVQAISEAEGVVLSAAFENSTSSVLGSDAGELAGTGANNVIIRSDMAAVVSQFDVLIDFSVPSATLAALALCAQNNKNLVIGTTGFDAAGEQAIKTAAKQISIVKSANLSVGVNLSFKLIEQAAAAMKEADVEIIEAHHRHKIDAPSGTAKEMGRLVAQARGQSLDDVAVYQRVGETGERKAGTIGFESIRAGDIVGEHTVMFVGKGERIEITHRASSRANYAEGAMRAVQFLATSAPGLFSMRDVLDL